MTLFQIGDAAVFGIALSIPRMPLLFAEFLKQYSDTVDLEIQGSSLVEKNFPASETAAFIRAVCSWGGYAGVAGRILKQNPIATIATRFRAAVAALDASSPSPSSALAEVNKLRGLGTPSFASKHLRFLRPKLCPVFDSILRDRLPYPFDGDGYSDFAADCAGLAAILTANKTVNPHPRRESSWFSADVEAALFASVNDWLADAKAT